MEYNSRMSLARASSYNGNINSSNNGSGNIGGNQRHRQQDESDAFMTLVWSISASFLNFNKHAFLSLTSTC